MKLELLLMSTQKLFEENDHSLCTYSRNNFKIWLLLILLQDSARGKADRSSKKGSVQSRARGVPLQLVLTFTLAPRVIWDLTLGWTPRMPAQSRWFYLHRRNHLSSRIHFVTFYHMRVVNLTFPKSTTQNIFTNFVDTLSWKFLINNNICDLCSITTCNTKNHQSNLQIFLDFFIRQIEIWM